MSLEPSLAQPVAAALTHVAGSTVGFLVAATFSATIQRVS
jgi:hypothetical protein